MQTSHTQRKKEGIGGWKEAQREGEDRITFKENSNICQRFYDGWKLDHINTIGQMGWNELHDGMNFENGWKLDHINTIGQMGWNKLYGMNLENRWKLTTLVQLAICVKWITWMNFEMDENGPY